MAKISAILFGTLFMLSTACYTGSFTANVESGQSSRDDVVHLRLALSGPQAQAAPGISALNQQFRIVGQQESTMMNDINGQSSTTTIWNLALEPRQGGPLTVPAISILTTEGELQTKPLAVAAVAPVSPSAVDRVPGLSLTAKIDRSQVYQNERVTLTFKLLSDRTLTNIQPDDFQIKDAIVDGKGQPRQFQEVVGGQRRQGLLISYDITPLKSGPLVIPPLVIHGETQAPAPSIFAQHNLANSFDEDDPFAQMQSMMDNFSQSAGSFGLASAKPVSLASQALTIDVLQPVATVNPWLPAKNLHLSESWGSEGLRVGEPLNRTITIRAEGVSPQQLPDLVSRNEQTNEMKVYPEPVKFKEDQAGAHAVSERQQAFTLIPQREGEITLPAIKIAWWDTQSRSARIAQLPERRLKILAALGTGLAQTQSRFEQAPQASLPAKGGGFVASMKTHFLTLKYVLFTLALALFAFAFREYLAISRVPHLHEPARAGERKPATNRKALLKCETESELLSFLQEYGHEQFGLPLHAPLATLFATVAGTNSAFDSEKAAGVVKQIEDVLYANKSSDVEKLREQISNLIFQPIRSSRSKPMTARLPELNPS